MAKSDTAKKAAAAVKASKKGDAESGTKSTSKSTPKSSSSAFKEVLSALQATYADYVKTLTPRLKLIDLFLVFLVALGVLQFVYVLLVGNFPFNAFLGGFISCVAQFVLTVSLRMQYAAAESKAEVAAESLEFTIPPQRAFFDYVFASLILHFLVIHFIN